VKLFDFSNNYLVLKDDNLESIIYCFFVFKFGSSIIDVRSGDIIISTFLNPLFDFLKLFICFKECIDYIVITIASIPFVYGAEPYGYVITCIFT